MRKAMLVIGMMSVLGGCERGAVPDTPLKQEGMPTVSPVASAVVEGVKGASASRDPESANGLTKRMLGAKAFTVNGFGSAPEGDAEEVIQGLEPAARGGSGSASYQIFLKLFDCTNQLKPGREPTSIGGQAWKECKDASPDRLLQSVDWLRLAADQGHLGAQMYFASDAEFVLGGVSGMFKDPDAVKEYKRQSMEYVEAAASRGYVDAMSHLANDYYVGLRVEQDLVSSHAYFLAAERADPSSGPSVMQKFVRDLLTPEQVAKSNEVARRIYEECCLVK